MLGEFSVLVDGINGNPIITALKKYVLNML